MFSALTAVLPAVHGDGPETYRARGESLPHCGHHQTMIVFAAGLGVLDPSGCSPERLDEVLVQLGMDNVTADVHNFIVACAGGDVPYVFRDSSGRMRGVGQALRPAEMLSELDDHGREDPMVPVLATGAGSWFAIDKDGRVWASLVVTDGTARRDFVQVASSFEAFSASLELDEGLLEDMIASAEEDGFPNRPADIVVLRRQAALR